ncbi:MAG TPA: NADH-quinone oxidoreductase subunit C [Thermoplasmata archaeon]|jgi:NADH:ubiquinone oxidoreductase subunit C|nr:NADH-quinone oxidoreductase subunit C [Thermoplasmata archaeon]
MTSQPQTPEELAAYLAPRLGDRLLGVEPFPETLGRVRFRREGALDLFRAMRDDLTFGHCSTVAGIDWVDHREVVYILWSDAARRYVLLSADLPADDPRIETACAIWPSANWHEREAWELVDITFEHHPDLRHLLMPDGYAFHPLLRSFKLHEPEELEVKSRRV